VIRIKNITALPFNFALRLALRKHARTSQKFGFNAKFPEFEIPVGCDAKFPICLTEVCTPTSDVGEER